MQATCAAPMKDSRHVELDVASASVELRSSGGRALLHDCKRFKKSSLNSGSNIGVRRSSSSINGHKSYAAWTALSRMKWLFGSAMVLQRLSKRESPCAPELPPERPRIEFTMVSSIRRLRQAFKLAYVSCRAVRRKSDVPQDAFLRG